MKKLLLGTTLLAGIALAAQVSSQEQHAGTRSTGGPDDYGYTFIDSNEPGGPTFDWKDITSTGTQINGLGDDGFVGPFNLGFDFPYYWYTSNQIWLQFNGAINLSAPTDMYHPATHPAIPSPAAPNDMIVFMGADLDFTEGGEAYFWTNNTDTAILEIVDLAEWNDPASYHTVEIILYKEGSNGHILIQYGHQNGDFDNGGQGIASDIGIEDLIGKSGLEYMRNNVPPENVPDSGLAVLWVRPDSSNYQVTDLALDMLWHEDHLGFFLCTESDTAEVPKIRVKNTGTEVIPSYTATITAKDIYGATVYTDTADGGSINPGEYQTVNFKNFNASTVGTGIYSVSGRISASGDEGFTNNRMDDVEFRIIDASTTVLSWDSDDPQSYTWWIGGANGDAGWGNRFPFPPTAPYRFQIDSVVAYVGSSLGAGGQVQVALLRRSDDNPMLPGDTLVISDPINIPNDGSLHTASVAVSGYDLWPGGMIYAGVFQLSDSTGCAVDDQAPFSRNFLEYTGSWANYRDRSVNDAYIRLYGTTVGITEDALAPKSFVLRSVGPVPTKNQAVFSFLVPAKGNVSVAVYNSVGQRVTEKTRSFDQGVGTMSVDLSHLSNGVYIYDIGYGTDHHSGKLVITR